MMTDVRHRQQPVQMGSVGVDTMETWRYSSSGPTAADARTSRLGQWHRSSWQGKVGIWSRTGRRRGGSASRARAGQGGSLHGLDEWTWCRHSYLASVVDAHACPGPGPGPCTGLGAARGRGEVDFGVGNLGEQKTTMALSVESSAVQRWTS
ncbi:hypothetical protein BC567DRAFT_76717 [Phyllosticta citribraziliensis]